MVVFGLSSSGEVINSGDSLENLGIVREVAAVTRGQDMPFFEMSEGVFNRNPRVEPVVLRSPMATLQLHAELI